MSPNPQYQTVKVTEQTENVSQQVITITKDKLKLKILQNMSKIDTKWSLLGPLGFVFTMTVTFCTTDFKNVWILDSKDVRAGFIAVTLLGVVVLARRVPFLWSSKSVDQFIDDIKTEE